MNLTVSPFKTLREKTGVTKANFARLIGVNDSTSTYIEQGLYENNPKDADEALLSLCAEKNVPVNDVLAEYGGGTLWTTTQAWRRAVRAALSTQVADGFQRARKLPENEDISPIEQFAREVSGTKSGFCKAIKIQVATMYQFDTGMVRSMPKPLREALLDAELPERYVEELNEEQQIFLKDHDNSLARVD